MSTTHQELRSKYIISTGDKVLIFRCNAASITMKFQAPPAKPLFCRAGLRMLPARMDRILARESFVSSATVNAINPALPIKRNIQ